MAELVTVEPEATTGVNNDRRDAVYFERADVLRGLAALGVALFHARVSLWVGWWELQRNPAGYSTLDHAVAWLSVPAPFLGSLVLLFFVLSGFCVHQPIAGSGERFEVRAFFTRRFFRIYPPYLGAVLVSFAVGAWLRLPSPPFGRIAATFLMLQNYAGIVNPALSGQPVANPALWSLPVEMELYFVYPLVWFAVRAWGWGAAMALVGGVSAAAALGYHSGLRFLEWNFALYWVIWCSGAWLRDLSTRRKLFPPPRWLTALAWLALAAALRLTMVGVGGITSVCWGLFYFWGTWSVLAMGSSEPARRSFVAEVWQTLGRFSYSLYLLHFPLFLLLGAAWLSWRGEKPTNYLVTWLACAAVLPVAWGYYRAVERPSHRWARWAGRRNRP
jgi:peptidoglycan/LPS O-acetylase OafA/YrhL